MSIFEKGEPQILIGENEYRDLLKNRERISILEDYMRSDGYKTIETVAMILGVKGGDE